MAAPTRLRADAEPVKGSGILARFFAGVIARRWLVVALYAALLPPAAFYAAKVQQDNSIDRLIVATDPDVIATRAFERVFGEGEFALLLAEAPDPLAPAVVARVDEIEQALAGIDHVAVNSTLSIYRRARAGFEPTPENLAAFRAFVSGTDLFKKQGLVGDRYLAIGLILDVAGTTERRAALAAIEQAIAKYRAHPAPFERLTELGAPWVDQYLDETQQEAWKYFVLFLAFVVALNVVLYRSVATLLAFLITLAVCLAFSVGIIGLLGGTLTIVSPMVPMTILVTATATLVYLHSRFVDRPPDREVGAHQVFAYVNKFVACTASIFATAVGFAALAVSDIRPIREMGAWVALGLAAVWVITLTLFPALQAILRTPTGQERRTFGPWIQRFATWLPRATYRWRWPLVASSLVLSALGAVALFGLPGVVTPMKILTNPVAYMNPRAPLYLDIQRLQPQIPGLSVTQVWLTGSLGSMSEPAVLNGIDAFQNALEKDPDVGSVVGPTTILRMIRYLSGQGDTWPTDPAQVEEAAAQLEGLVGQEPLLQRFVQPHELAQAQLTVVSRKPEYEDLTRLADGIRAAWGETVARIPALKSLELRIVGLAPLHAKMAQGLVPTLVESFVLTVAIIFAAFFVVFRSGTARLMAMIPSIFAILVMFLVMRLAGMQLNIATILIASTVLGTSENDQIHFFYHFLEGRKDGDVEHALTHTLLVAGRAILFATMINAGGFLAFGFAELPPIAQFGMLAALAFALSMIADFTALPAALWILFREKPRDAAGR
ncbi:MAG: MMPL family transporter [Deltaproteobacteria bacterium]|nr:MMPL family transporter [Deltaproteobacteria bacterium]